MRSADVGHRESFRNNAVYVGAGFVAKECPHVLDVLSALAPHLGRWDPRNVAIDVSLRDRGGKEQRIVLRTMVPGLPSLVTVAENPDINRGLVEAKRELIRQLEHQTSTFEQLQNRLPAGR